MVNQTVLPDPYAVPIASFAPSVHRGAIPGPPNALLAVRTIAIFAYLRAEDPARGWRRRPTIASRLEVALAGVFPRVPGEVVSYTQPRELARGPDVGVRHEDIRPIH